VITDNEFRQVVSRVNNLEQEVRVLKEMARALTGEPETSFWRLDIEEFCLGSIGLHDDEHSYGDPVGGEI
jgi:hypothetical protein